MRRLYAIGALLWTWLLIVGSASAATISVTTFDDELNADGDCSLREAIESANSSMAVDGCTTGTGDDLILLGEGTYALTVDGAGEGFNATGDLDIDATIEIQGVHASQTIIDAQFTDPDRLFDVGGGGTLRLNRVTVQNGHAVETTAQGGCIRALGPLEVTRSIVQDCHADGTASGNGGGIYANGTSSSLSESIVRRCRATGLSARGGGYDEGAGSLSCARSLVHDNVAEGTGSGNGGGAYKSGAGAISMCTFVANQALGASASGGGLYYAAVSGGSAPQIVASTIARNAADTNGGGIFSASVSEDSGPRVKSTIFADNVAPTGPDGDNRIQSYGHLIVGDDANFQIDTDGLANTAVGNQINVNPMLTSLAFKGGHTATLQPAQWSPAIDAGSCTNINDVTVPSDARRVAKPQGSECDVGAYEFAEADGNLVVSSIVEPPGDNCLVGGQRLDMGYDNGALGATANDALIESAEAVSTWYVCDTPETLTAASAEPAGSNCPFGGQRLDIGADDSDGGGTAANGVLEPGEIDETLYVCADAETLLSVSAADAADCEHGGQRIDIGDDDGDGGGTANDGVLQSGEIDETTFICNGAPGDEGTAGPQGDDGTSGEEGQQGDPGDDGAPGEQGPAGEGGCSVHAGRAPSWALWLLALSVLVGRRRKSPFAERSPPPTR